MKVLRPRFDIYLVIIILSMVFLFFSTYSEYHPEGFPYHQDEWQHIAISIQIMEEGHNAQFNPYLGIDRPTPDLEPGFHLLLASFFSITGLDPVLSYGFLASVVAAFTVLVLYLSMYQMTKDKRISLVSSLIFLTLPTNVNILGIKFLVPFTFSLPFMFLYIASFIEAFRGKEFRKFFLPGILLLLIFSIHPPGAVILLLPSFIYVLMDMKEIIRKRWVLPMAAALSVSMISIIALFWNGNLSRTISYLFSQLIFEPGWGRLDVSYNLILLFGVLNTLLASIGFIYVLRKYLFVKKETGPMTFFFFMSFISLLLISVFVETSYSFLVPYQRNIHYAMIGMIPLAAYALVLISDILAKKLDSGLAFPVLCIIVLIFSSLQTYDMQDRYDHYEVQVINREGYDSLIWFRDNIGRGNILITPYLMTSAVYPISRNKVIALVPAQMGGGMIDENLNFFSYDCEEKIDVIRSSGAGYVLSRSYQYCPGFKLIYGKGPYIYEVSELI